MFAFANTWNIWTGVSQLLLRAHAAGVPHEVREEPDLKWRNTRQLYTVHQHAIPNHVYRERTPHQDARPLTAGRRAG